MTKKHSNQEIDTTIADIHRTRARISDESKGDVHAITQAARKRQEKSGRRTVSFAHAARGQMRPSGESSAV